MTTIDVGGIRLIAIHLRRLMDANRDRMLELDRAIGDGDLGLTMTRAFAAAEEASAMDEQVPGRILMRMGMAMSKAAPSTMGTLMATGFMRGGKALGEASAIGTVECAVFLRAFVEGLMERGKTRPGHKTVVDSLDPAATALEVAAANGDDLVTALSAAAAAAEAGRQAAKGMLAQHGRAAMFREQTIGMEDGGAYVGALLVRGMSEAVATGG